MDNTNAANLIIKVLQDGLIFRRATESDEENIEILSQLVHSGPLGMEEEDGFSFFKKYAKGPHPPTTIEHFVVIENTRSNPGANPIVAVTCLVKELCMYGSVPFIMGRPEIIGTHPDFRGRGFVHLMMEYINNLCDKENLLLDGITGIPFFYRQFGYEFALALDSGDGVKLDDIPPLNENNQYFLRSAQLQDYDDYSAFHDLNCTTSLISMSVNPDIWNHALTCWKDNEKIMRTYIIYMIYSKSFSETPVGVAVVMYNRWTHCQTVTEIVLGSLETNTMYPTSKVEEMLPDILSILKHNLSKDLIPQRDKEPPLSMLKLNITKRNPIHSALMNLKLYSTPSNPYACVKRSNREDREWMCMR
ncbi:hypothetical protein K7432_013416 [Basidiobolus ranarum]|uniref:N-acetyltransferase domain-containing protein n=1 Tax=Basidiobolus ranarum TaxID=34480 RepID=A0ABR2WJA1_9FUNG